MSLKIHKNFIFSGLIITIVLMYGMMMKGCLLMKMYEARKSSGHRGDNNECWVFMIVKAGLGLATGDLGSCELHRSVAKYL
jgi:hypothetical protein